MASTRAACLATLAVLALLGCGRPTEVPVPPAADGDPVAVEVIELHADAYGRGPVAA